MSEIDWEVSVKEYQTEYSNDEGVNEWVESLLPVYYSNIYQAYHDHIGTPLVIEITANDIGLSVWQIMTRELHDEYMECFMEAYNAIEEEE
jgi:hypothetical protein